ncbi:MAG: phosphate ABC transporter substrate-binding protein PstS [Gemmatimonadota bacterium]|nr:phosphate ABC transporter substrate-binding protein PstS [Gemmatimonadota bacterium]MDQ8147483.1 phosphate ABC transporter substrate-binding protein PstS [Gemmatimonadota bacterium]MDQ8148774.1 phosphate ABC transporter substrate-binding protein PstS [Gemmatimonadota bacterium]MDQ8156753.1 phosphate ABC transporter substrate-binding protein PstS [Gemmatimonadota bacterium]MDQ8176523.1 phosphate ABC transporter substrate-binding protein PstS [Gemmatimonadota bacterium]
MEHRPPRPLTWLRGAALLWIGALVGFAGGMRGWRDRPATPAPSGTIDLVGAGATFPYPLYRRWFEEYGQGSGVRINYFSVGSPEGLRLLRTGGADFGAVDRPLTAAERGAMTCGPLEVATAIGAVAIVANLPSAEALRLDAATLSALLGGGVTRWDDPTLVALNPSLADVRLPVLVARRESASGTADLVAAYLGDAVATPAADVVGTVVPGNEGVAAFVRATPGAVGFVELSYARQARLTPMALRNRAGRFVAPDSLSMSATAEALLRTPRDDVRGSLVGAEVPEAYPIVGITRIVADQALGDPTRGAHLIAFMRWALAEGTADATALGYTPLPTAVRRRLDARLAGVVPGRCPGGVAE